VFVVRIFSPVGVRLVAPPVDPFSAKKVRATQQAAIRKIRTSDNRRWPQPILDARRVTHRVFVAEVARKSVSGRASLEEYSSSWRKIGNDQTAAISRTQDFWLPLARWTALPLSR